MQPEITSYINTWAPADQEIAHMLLQTAEKKLPEAELKLWHGHPVWFLDKNPVMGFDRLKHAMRILFWSGQSFDEPELKPEGKFKAAEFRCTQVSEIHPESLSRWIEKARTIQWDYANLVKRKGLLLPKCGIES
jgi:hypothetical protein